MTPGPTAGRVSRPADVGVDADLLDVLDATLEYARTRDYTGWDYGDGMSSRLLQWLPVDNKYLNLATQELVKRPPVNLRPLLLVEKRRNFKGTALFALANQYRDGLSGAESTTDVDHRAEVRALNDWLLANRSVGYEGFCGGHKHPIQHLDGRGHPNDPDVVSTSFAVKSLLAAGDVDPVYPAVARTAADFVVSDLAYRPTDGGAKINYHMNHPDTYYTINAGALGARLFVDLYAQFGEDVFLERARNLLDYIADLQTDLGGWAYREPPSSSHLSMDNHHNGFVVGSYLRYRNVVGDGRYDETLGDGLRFFREELFEPSGAPNWDESSSYPRDIHAAATGIEVFALAGELAFARRIIDWTLDNLYVGDGRFYYRKHRLYTVRTTLMRWCQAWMAYALATYLRAQARTEAEPESEHGSDVDATETSLRNGSADGSTPRPRPDQPTHRPT